MSGTTVDLMVVGMAAELSAEELSERLIKEFNQPADAFDALITAATGAGPAYAAQSGVNLDDALEGKDKLESLGLHCSIPGVYEHPGTSQAVGSEESDKSDADGAVEHRDEELNDIASEISFDDGVAVNDVSVDGSDAVAGGDFTDAADNDDDALASFDAAAEIEDQQPGEEASPEFTVDDDETSFDFADELEALSTQEDSSGSTQAEESTTDELAFEEALDDLEADLQSGSEALDAEVPLADEEIAANGDTSSEIVEDEDATPAENQSDETDLSDIAISDDNDTPLTRPRKSSNIELDDGGLSLATDDNIVPIKASSNDVPEALANRPPADVGDELSLSLADEADDSAKVSKSAEITTQKLPVGHSISSDELPELETETQAEEPIEQSDESIEPANTAGLQEPAAIEEGVGAELENDKLSVADAVDVALSEPSDAANEDSSSVAEQVDSSADSVDVSATPGAVPKSIAEELIESLQGAGPDSDGTSSGDTVSATVAAEDAIANDEQEQLTNTREQVADLQADTAEDQSQNEQAQKEVDEIGNNNTPQDSDVALPDDSVNTSESPVVQSASPRSIAEELIESLQAGDSGSEDSSDSESTSADSVEPAVAESVDSTVTDGMVSSGSYEEEQLRKSREQVAVLQKKVEEDEVEEQQVYQEFEQIAKKRMLLRVASGAGAVAALAVIGSGVYFSGVLKPAPESAPVMVAQVEPQRDIEQESLNAAIERSATLINPETLSTEELLTTLAEGSGQDTLGDLRRYILGGSSRSASLDNDGNVPRAGAAIPADVDSMKLLKNRVAHSGDKYFDKWSRREIDLRLYIELVDRLVDAGDIVAAIELCNRTKDNLFAVMGKQSVARAYKKSGDNAAAEKLLETASRNTYSIASPAERVVAMADYAYSEHVIGRHDDALDSFLSVSILAASLNRPEHKTVGLTVVSDYLMRVGQDSEARKQLDRANEAALELPGNSAARDLALRHIALTEASMGLFDEAISHTDQIIDPFASVSAYHGIALEYESRENYLMATEVIQKAFDASFVITDKEKRKQLLSKIRLANSD